MPYKDPAKKREYQRQWKARRRQAWIESMGGVCAVCEYDEGLEIDHIDRSTKVYNPTDVWSRSLTVRHRELVKCQLLCNTCHWEKTTREERGQESWTPPTTRQLELPLLD